MLWILIAASMLQTPAGGDRIQWRTLPSAEAHFDCVEPLFTQKVDIQAVASCRLNGAGAARDCTILTPTDLTPAQRSAAICVAQASEFHYASGRSPAGARVEVPVHLRHNLD